jgi:hypothetical protein
LLRDKEGSKLELKFSVGLQLADLTGKAVAAIVVKEKIEN